MYTIMYMQIIQFSCSFLYKNNAFKFLRCEQLMFLFSKTNVCHCIVCTLYVCACTKIEFHSFEAFTCRTCKIANVNQKAGEKEQKLFSISPLHMHMSLGGFKHLLGAKCLKSFVQTLLISCCFALIFFDKNEVARQRISF